MLSTNGIDRSEATYLVEDDDMVEVEIASVHPGQTLQGRLINHGRGNHGRS